MPTPAPGTVPRWRTGVLSVDVPSEFNGDSCVVLETDEGRFDLLSAEGLWVPTSSVRKQGHGAVVIAGQSGINRGNGRRAYGPIVFGYGERVRIKGEDLVPPPQGFPGDCDGVSQVFSVIDVEAAP